MEQEFITDVGPVLNLKFKISSDNSDADSFEGKYHFLYFRKGISLTCPDRVEIEAYKEPKLLMSWTTAQRTEDFFMPWMTA